MKRGRSDNYVKVKAILIAKTRDAIYVSRVTNDVREPHHWVALSLIHAADEAKITNEHMTEVIEFRLREWKAREIGL